MSAEETTDKMLAEITAHRVRWAAESPKLPPVDPELDSENGRGSWQPINLSTIEGKPPVKPGGAIGLLYPGRRHIFSGPPESLKTIAAGIEILNAARVGGTAILIDLEMGPWDTRDRLRELGATDAELASIHYVEPETPATPEIIAGLVALEPDLVVIDAAAGAYELQGLDDGKRADVEKFARLYVNAFKKAGISTILIDHVVKSAENRGKFAIGSERKLGGCDVHIGFDATKPLHRGGTGFVKVTVHKDRFGYLPRPTIGTLRLVSDPETHAITWTLEQSVTSGDEWQPTALMAKVSNFLAGQTEPVSRTVIEEAKLGKGVEYVRAAIDALIAGGHVTETKGPRGGRLNQLTRPYTTPSDAVPRRPDGDATTPSDPVHPLQGDGVRDGVTDGVTHPDRDDDEITRLLDLGHKHGLT